MSRYFFSFILSWALLLPRVVGAAIVQCGNAPGTFCNFCDFFVVIKNVFDFLALQIAPVLAVVLIIFGGLLTMFGGGFPGTEQKPGLRGRGKRVISGTLFGLVIVLLSWIVVSTIINTLTGTDQPEGFQWPWYDPQC